MPPFVSTNNVLDWLPFSVDTFKKENFKEQLYHFVSHAHTDHLGGIPAALACGMTIVSTSDTRALVRARNESKFRAHCDRSWREIPLGVPQRLPARDGTSFTVTAYDANHMRGSAMFLFEGEWTNPLEKPCRRVLHTGDACLDAATVAQVPLPMGSTGQGPKVDILLLDCTFGDFLWDFKDRAAVVDELLKAVDAYSATARVYVAAPLGNEELLERICQKYNTKVFATATAPAAHRTAAKRTMGGAAASGEDKRVRGNAGAANRCQALNGFQGEPATGNSRDTEAELAAAQAEWSAASSRRAELRALGLEDKLLTAEPSARFHLMYSLEGLPGTAQKSKSEFFQGGRAVLKDVNGVATAPMTGVIMPSIVSSNSSEGDHGIIDNSGEKPPMYIRTSAQILKTFTQDFKMQVLKNGCAFEGSNLLRGFISYHSSQRQLIAAVKAWQPAHVMVTAGQVGGNLKTVLNTLPR